LLLNCSMTTPPCGSSQQPAGSLCRSDSHFEDVEGYGKREVWAPNTGGLAGLRLTDARAGWPCHGIAGSASVCPCRPDTGHRGEPVEPSAGIVVPRSAQDLLG